MVSDRGFSKAQRIKGEDVQLVLGQSEHPIDPKRGDITHYAMLDLVTIAASLAQSAALWFFPQSRRGQGAPAC
jgi:hypothetical protein